MTKEPNCYECKFRGDLIGNAHSRCNAHMYKPYDDISVVGHPHGIRSGWFAWPFNFDPSWLVSCNVFEKKDD